VWVVSELIGRIQAQRYLVEGYTTLASFVARDCAIGAAPILIAGIPVVVAVLRLARRPASLARLISTVPLFIVGALITPSLNIALRSGGLSRMPRAALLVGLFVVLGLVGLALGHVLGRGRPARLFEALAGVFDSVATSLRSLPFVRHIAHQAFVALAVVLCAAAVVLPGLMRPSPPTDQSFVVILLDTLRADHLGCYGYERLTSPSIDHLADRSIFFENGIAQASWTKPSVASLFTSLFPSVHITGSGKLERRVVRGETLEMSAPPEGAPRTTGSLSPGLVTIAELFRENGYRTAGFIGNGLVSARDGYGQGFEIYNVLGDRAITAQAKRWIASHRDEPFFLYLHYMTPHAPYTPPERFNRFATEAPRLNIHNTATKDSINFTRTLELSDEELGLLIDLYDGEILTVDDMVGQVMGALDAAGLSENTVVFLTADHGEEFMDHGMVWHESIHLYRELVRVPFILFVPECGEARRVASPVMHVDVAPTLLDLAVLEIPGELQGRSLASICEAEPLDSRAAYVEALDWGDLSTVLCDSKKLIYDREAQTVELYDIESDPGETRDISADDPDTRRALLDSLQLFDERNLARSGEVGAAWTPIDADQEERLRSLGYMQ